MPFPKRSLPLCLTHCQPKDRCAHRRCRISAGLIWFWECCSSGWISVRSPVCFPWTGRPNLCTSDLTGTSLKWNGRQEDIKPYRRARRKTQPSTFPHALSLKCVESPSVSQMRTEPSVAGGSLNTKVKHAIEPNFHRYMELVTCSWEILGVKKTKTKKRI